MADLPVRSLRNRLLAWLIVATAFIGTLALIDTRNEAGRTAQQVSDRVLIGSAMAIAQEITVDAESGLSVAIPFSALDMLSSTAQDQVFYRVDGPGGLLTGYGDLSPASVAPGSETGLADDIYRDTAIRKATLALLVTSEAGAVPVTVTVAESTRARDQLSSAILSRSALRIAGLIAVAALAAWGATTLALRPLDRMTQRLAERSPQELSPIETPGLRELVPVVSALNEFLLRLQRAMSALANFSSNANHQIRTPLTVARTQVGLARKLKPDARVAAALDKADAALVRTERVLEQLLLLARVEASGRRLTLAPCDVAALSRTIAEEELPRAMQLGQDLGYDGPASAFAVSEEVLLGEAVRNLVMNALQHCPPGTSVTLRVRDGADRVEIDVVDDGPPLSPDRFAQLETRLTVRPADGQIRSGHHGLGLHVVREIAEVIGCEVTLGRNTGGSGLTTSLKLPKSLVLS